MRAQGPRSRGLGPWWPPCPGAPGGRCPLCPRCPVRWGHYAVRLPRGDNLQSHQKRKCVSWAARSPLRGCGSGALLLFQSVCLYVYTALIVPSTLANKPVLADVIIATSSQLRSQTLPKGNFCQRIPCGFSFSASHVCAFGAGTGHLPRNFVVIWPVRLRICVSGGFTQHQK